jgi:signal recognition particle GTPase
MRRWFRRKGQEEEKREEETEAPLVEETEPSPEAAGDVPAAGENESGELKAAPPEAVLPEAETGFGPERRGFLRRWRRESQPEDAAPITIEEGAAESEAVSVALTPAPQPEPPPIPSPEPAPAIPTAPEPELAAPPPEVWAEEAAPVLPEAEDLEETGEAPEAAERRGMFRRLRQRLSRTREALSGGMDRLFRGRKVVDAELLEDLEELLITADLGV